MFLDGIRIWDVNFLPDDSSVSDYHRHKFYMHRYIIIRQVFPRVLQDKIRHCTVYIDKGSMFFFHLFQ